MSDDGFAERVDRLIKKHAPVLEALAAYDRGECDDKGRCVVHGTFRGSCECVTGGSSLPGTGETE